MVRQPGLGEEQVGQSIEKDAGRGVDRFELGQSKHITLSPPTDRPRQVQAGGQLGPAGEDKGPQGRERIAGGVDLAFELADVVGFDRGSRALSGVGGRQLCPQVKQPGLDGNKGASDGVYLTVGQSKADGGVEFIDAAVRGDPDMVFRDADAADQVGEPIVAAFGVELHGVIIRHGAKSLNRRGLIYSPPRPADALGCKSPMKHALRILICLMTLTFTTAWAQPALAARLASVEGSADMQEVRDSSAFKLGEEAQLEINYSVTKTGDNCNVQVRIYRQLNGQWRVVNVVLQTDGNDRSSRSITLPAGDYKIEVVATDARFSVSVDN